MSKIPALLPLVLLQALSFSSGAQNDPVTVTATGYGATIDEATTASVRSALEQTFGVFLSSDTRIEMKEDGHSSESSILDEMAVLTNGNILDYSVVSSALLDNGEAAVTTRCTIALEPMQSFVKSQGHSAEFAGGMFGRTIKLRELNVLSESRAMQDLVDQTRLMLGVAVDFSVFPGEPQSDNNQWILPIRIESHWNENFEAWRMHILKSLEGITMTDEEVSDFQKTGQETFLIAISTATKSEKAEFKELHFRNLLSVSHFLDMLNVVGQALINFELDAGAFKLTGLDSWNMVLEGNGTCLSSPLGVPAAKGKDCSTWDFPIPILDIRRPVDLTKYSLLEQQYFTGNGKRLWGDGEATSNMPAGSIAALASRQFLTGAHQERPVSDGLGGLAYVQAGCLSSTLSGRSDEILVWNPQELDTSIDTKDKTHAALLIHPRFDLGTIETIQRLDIQSGNALKLK